MHSLKLILSNYRYFSVVWVFCSLNIMIGTWVLYIPHVKQKLQLNDSEIGLALFALALGLLCFIPIVPFLTRSIGLGKCTLLGIVVFSISFIGPFIAPTYILLCVSLFVVGVFSALTDISMNTLISEIEKREGVNIMSAAHGFFSLGGVIGALLGTFLMGFFSVPFQHILVMMVLVLITNLLLARHYYFTNEATVFGSEKYDPFKMFKPLFIIALLAFVIMSSEGAIEHWSAIYLIDIVQVTPENLAGLGFAAFSVMMTLGRFFGDRISTIIGSTKTIVYGCSLACFGYILILFSTFTSSISGFGLLGLGLSVVVPEIYRVAGNVQGISTAKSISFVSGVGFVGFLLGPVILGFVSDSFSLRASFLFLLILTLVALGLLILKPRFRRHHKN